MVVRFTKLSDEQHRLTIEREDGGTESQTLVSREFLLHDFVHLALEEEAKIKDGVWGLLAQGTSFEKLNDREDLFFTPGLRTAETLAGPMQAVFKGKFSAEQYQMRFGPDFPFVDTAFVGRVAERIRKLMGHYRGTPMHETMCVEVFWT